MSHIALARKWRPRTFTQLVGQPHVCKALTYSLTEQRLHHAYLFTGTRGVGKTSIARLFAKALNCEKGISAEPCLVCPTCLSIEQGHFIDLIEIDAASKTRVEDTREILENVQYSPTQGRFKIYLIDEVHMLSQHSFNALLKTLEEPPAHVMFLLATTDPQKLPVTVLSRCLHFNLKPLSLENISQWLAYIMKEEGFAFEPQALDLIAKAAQGSMRDALSLLDQALASCNNSLVASEIKNILGYTKKDYALEILHALAAFNPNNLIHISREIASEGGNFIYVLEEMVQYLHQITICQTLSADSPFINSSEELIKISKNFQPEDTQLFYEIAVKSLEEIQLAPALGIGFEMALLRMYTFRPATQEINPQLGYEFVKVIEEKDTEYVRPEPSLSQTSLDVEEDNLVEEPFLSNNLPHQEESWASILAKLSLNGLAQTAVEHSEFVSKLGKEVTLRVNKGHQSLFTPAIIGRIEQALTNYYKDVVKLIISCEDSIPDSPAQQKKIAGDNKRKEAELALQNDPFFQQLQQEFSAEVVKDSIVSIKDDL
ncbi:DNA polymerase III, gamma and tau subunits (plasmid) [Legionella adelaidensis]|uniref:DNA polymerase III subunit gamma/tau n=1 Tax=Legionella adelaidensis TaxID=45056 RepID=A0A0W0R2K5_9GAMM|nr:DNA polymerase III subunit gamma/tau [Legionella adelaidensis]KTC65288.1 DNA polymerase III, subunit gamma and tau [Legionella adelaidensis]VEH81216.1 DNA polymerase III, gamma and tau subunits [Legionella adelaidensis]